MRRFDFWSNAGDSYLLQTFFHNNITIFFAGRQLVVSKSNILCWRCLAHQPAIHLLQLTQHLMKHFIFFRGCLFPLGCLGLGAAVGLGQFGRGCWCWSCWWLPLMLLMAVGTAVDDSWVIDFRDNSFTKTSWDKYVFCRPHVISTTIRANSWSWRFTRTRCGTKTKAAVRKSYRSTFSFHDFGPNYYQFLLFSGQQ